jgi:hypothetical protein
MKENSHDVKDFYVLDKKVRFVRVISRKNGNIYFVRCNNHDIRILEDCEYFQKSNIFYLEKYHSELEDLEYLYDVFLRAFPEYHFKYILFNGYFMMQEKNLIFQIKNLSSSDYFGFYLYLDIEWFFENIYIVSHEIEKIMNDVQSKVEKMYFGFLPHYNSFCQSPDYREKVESVWEFYNEHVIQYDKCRKLYLDICGYENDRINDFDFNEKISDSDDLNMQQIIHRQYQKKKLTDKLNQTIHLKIKTLEKIIFHYCMYWKIILQFLILISKFTKLQGDFFTMINNLENIITKKKKVLYYK